MKFLHTCEWEDLLAQQRQKNRNLIREITNYIPPHEYKYHPPSPLDIARAAHHLGFMSKAELNLVRIVGI